MPKASVIVVNWNGKEYLKTCMDSLRNQTFKDFEIVFVDNASTDDSVEFVKQNYPDCVLVLNTANRGFAGGNNDGVKVAKGDICVLLNTDVECKPDWLEKLIMKFDQLRPAVAWSMVASRYTGKAHKEHIGTTTILGHAVEWKNQLKSQCVETVFAGGCTMTFRNTGVLPFDDDYFLYAEDTAFSWKNRLMGRKIFIFPKSIVLHEGEGSAKKMGGKAFWQQRNRLMNLFIFYSFTTLIKLFPLILLNMTLTGLKDWPHRVKANLWLLFHIPTILRKRKAMQALRTVPDEKITSKMSGKFFDGYPVLNNLQLAYLKMVGIKTVES